jgi:hypothetical protein
MGLKQRNPMNEHMLWDEVPLALSEFGQFLLALAQSTLNHWPE